MNNKEMTLEKTLNNHKTPFFYPYVGDDYSTSSTKIWVLGDSHYCKYFTECEKIDSRIDNEDCFLHPYKYNEICPYDEGDGLRNNTRTTINNYISDGGTQTFDRLINIFSETEEVKSTTLSERRNVFSKIVFSNYVQTFLHGSNNNWSQEFYGETFFEQFLSCFEHLVPRPQLILGLGLNVRGALTSNFANRDQHLESISKESNPGKDWLFRGYINRQEFTLCILYHPGFRFYDRKIHQKNIDRFKKALLLL